MTSTTGTTAGTDPTGRCFLSYRSTRRGEAELLVQALHDVGVPTWQDRRDLDHVPTEERIREVLHDPATAGTLLWITPDVSESEMIRRVEAPLAMHRHQRHDGFFVVPVAAGGLDYTAAAGPLGGLVRGEDLGGWNLHVARGDPIDEEEALDVARRVLRRRLLEIHQRQPAGVPLRLVINTWGAPRWEPGLGLAIDWSARCQGRPNDAALWSTSLLPALDAVVNTIAQEIGDGRAIEVSGSCSLAAAVALGSRFLRERGIPVSWLQPGAGAWALSATPAETGLSVDLAPASLNGQELAVLVSVSTNVRRSFEMSRADLPDFRAILTISPTDGSDRHDISGPAEAAAVALQVQRAIREARREYWEIAGVHLFLAVPVGLAMMIGQLLNTLGEVHTYEHLPAGAGRYVPAALLQPAG